MSHDPEIATPIAVLSWHVAPGALRIYRNGVMIAEIPEAQWPGLIADIANRLRGRVPTIGD
jgi:hypothetical protein